MRQLLKHRKSQKLQKNFKIKIKKKMNYDNIIHIKYKNCDEKEKV